ncbi:K(+)-transporting ATPase subunit C [Nitrosomonas sp.]|uniref:K(+)-transporting ATPase subunit C n=1 Tax=Nitrosomonas sp. TaxID=42353 RepID=UPI0025CC3AF1|nr:K(+)-transporting ATPase subunit C [Nitrosomonas sp.]MCC6916072.1 K(+)-transporting ATPase subunit C [Nitrosomonas sp.]
MRTLNHLNPSPAATAIPGSPLKGLSGPCVRGALFVALLTGMVYPLAITGVAQLLFAYQANGSLIADNQGIVGSGLIGQAFTSPRYFHPRPSATIPGPYNAGASAGSNLGPTNQTLIDNVKQRATAYRQANGLAVNALVPVDAVTASASGLDPHISVANATLQAARVAQARGLAPGSVQQLLVQHTEGRVFGIFGEPRVNVLCLNLALDALKPSIPSMTSCP